MAESVAERHPMAERVAKRLQMAEHFAERHPMADSVAERLVKREVTAHCRLMQKV